MKLSRLRVGFFFIILSSTACVNLKQVNDYSSKSLEGVQKFEELNFDFKQYCLDRCLLEAIRKTEIKREPECDCALYKSADSVTLIIYTAIRGYFDGLTHLSNDNVTTYKLDALTKALKEGEFGDVKITKDEAAAYNTISTILLHAITDAYRKDKIKLYISQANQPIQSLLDKFHFILQTNLEGELNFKKERWYAYYEAMNLTDDISDYEKGRLIIEYYQGLSAINQKQEQIDLYAKSLKRIAEGHQKLFENLDKLSAKEIGAMMSQYASDIQDLISAFNKLKK